MPSAIDLTALHNCSKEEAWLQKDTAYKASELRKAMAGADAVQVQGGRHFALKDMEQMQAFSQELKRNSLSSNGISIGEEIVTQSIDRFLESTIEQHQAYMDK